MCTVAERTHELKTWPSYFEAILRGEKRHECRLNDRDFAVGDVLVLREWDPSRYQPGWAGHEFTWAFDYSREACDSYEANLGHRPVQMDVRDLLRLMRAGWRPPLYCGNSVVDLLVADPPCTPWSRAGKRLGTADERDMLGATCELIALLRPRAYLIGNVPGLQDSSSWGVVQEYIGGLAKHGYCVRDYAQLDAADYGVPQNRVRPFWFGHLDGPCVRWPAPTHQGRRGDRDKTADPRMQLALGDLGLLPWVTCREALGHLQLEDLGRPVRLKRIDSKHPPCDPGEPSTTVRSGGDGNSHPHVVLGNKRHPAAAADAPAPTLGAKDRGQSTVLRLDNPNYPPMSLGKPSQTITAAGSGAKHLLEHPVGESRLVGSWKNGNHLPSHADRPALVITAAGTSSASSVVVAADDWPWDRPSTTIMRDERIQPPGHHDGGSIRSQPNAIVLSERAATILQGFPDRFVCSYGHTSDTADVGGDPREPLASRPRTCDREALTGGVGICGADIVTRPWQFVAPTKTARWSFLGQAMPPPLAEAVARVVLLQMEAARCATAS
jgi:site-specific DNA-cytosine methylase